MEILASLWIIGAVGFAGLGVWIGAQTGRRKVEGFWLGLLFGAVGAIIAALLPRGVPEAEAEDERSAPRVDRLEAMPDFGRIADVDPGPLADLRLGSLRE